MKTSKSIFGSLFCLLIFTVTLYTQNEQQPFTQNSAIPQSLLEKLNAEDDAGSPEEKQRLNQEAEEYLVKTPQSGDIGGTITSNFNNPPYQPDWYNSDVQVYSGNIGSPSHRRFTLLQGQDGWMYYAVAKTGAGGIGSITVYFSTNGGANWPYLITYASPGFIHSISMVLQSRTKSNADSTRFMVYFTYSPTASQDNASLYCWSSRRNGTASYITLAASPVAGNKLEYVSACTDNITETSTPYSHAVVREATNAGAQQRLLHLRSIDCGESHTGAGLQTNNDDYYPSIAFSNESGTDSIYIAVERRVSSTEYELRMLTTSEIPTSTIRVFYITSASSGIKYEKPVVTIVQQYYNVPKKIMVTCTKNRNPRFHYSNDGGGTWDIDNLLGPNSSQVADFTMCNSDTLVSGGQYIIGGYVTDDGDSVSVRQGTITGFSFNYYKRNTNQSSGVVAPVCAIYKTGSIKYAAFGYAGFGPTDVYYNSEQLTTGIQHQGNSIPEEFSISQNYPNPFNPATNINFQVPVSGNVKLSVYDILGKEVAVLADENLAAGSYKVDFNAGMLPSGVYFYKFSANGFTAVKKMMLVK
jgi:hypothetical protein